MELVVRDGQAFTIGDNGAEFFHYQKDDIIFNASQTEELLKNGKLTGAHSRGKAFANGTVGKAFIGGSVSGGWGSDTWGTPKIKKTYDTTDSSKSSDKTEKETEEVFDWIEVLISRIERRISKFDKIATSSFKSWSTRMDALGKQMTTTSQEISIQQQAKDRYMKQANSVGLSETWASKVRNGEIDIDTVTDEDLADKIKDYQTWYNKVLDCEDAIEELNESLHELAKQNFENVKTQFEELLSTIEHKKDMLDGLASKAETSGYFVSEKYYSKLISQEQSNLKTLKNELNSLQSTLTSAVASGQIKENTEAWYDMKSAIEEVEKSILDAETAMIEYKNSIRETRQEMFEFKEDQISQITDESDFLIDLLDSRKLFDDKGKITKEGLATQGLHAVNYNVYLAQAKDYAAEIKKIDADIAKDPYNKELVERRNELLGLQRDAISSAKDEKEAIRDLVRDGYETMLSALQKLIDKRKDLLQSEKDLYDYSNTIKDKTDNIDSIKKQLEAYKNDDSEEGKSKRQSLGKSLKEAQQDLESTEYDKYISDQEAMLDALYDAAEEWVNERLDNLEAIIKQSVAETNANATTIGSTLQGEITNMGGTLSANMTNIWATGGNANNVVSTYSKNIVSAISTVNGTLGSINEYVKNMKAYLDNKAAAEAAAAQAAAQAKAQAEAAARAQAQAQQTQTPNPTPAQQPASQPAWGSWFITGGQYYDRRATNTENSIVDRLKSRSIRSDFNARASYYASMGGSGSYTGSASQNRWMINQMKAHGYRKGSKDIPYSQLAWTQEGQDELIYRSSDGAMLTPLNPRDKVFTGEMTENLWNMAQSGLVPKVSTNQVIGSGEMLGNTIQLSLDNITMYGVNDPKQFATDLVSSIQNNKDVQNTLTELTSSRMLGSNSLKIKRFKG